MRADQRELLALGRRRVHRRPQRAVELLDVGEAVLAARRLGHPRRVLVQRAEARDERLRSSSRARPPAPAARAANASTSTSPRSVIFSDGITDSARNESVMNGALDRHALLGAAGPAAASSRSRPPRPARRRAGPATGSAARRATAPSRATTIPPPISCEPRGAQRHVGVVDADDHEVVRVVGDGRGERARAAARSRARARARRGPSRGGARSRRSSPGRAPDRRPRAPSATAARSTPRP